MRKRCSRSLKPGDPYGNSQGREWCRKMKRKEPKNMEKHQGGIEKIGAPREL